MKKRLIVGAALVAAGAVQAAVVTSWQYDTDEATIASFLTTDAAAGITTEADFTHKNFTPSLTTDGVLGGSWNNNNGNTADLSRYKIDLGVSVEIGAVNTFSYSQDSSRIQQSYTLYGSTTDTASFDETDAATWTAIGSFDNLGTDLGSAEAWAVTSMSDDAGSLGTYREIMWVTTPNGIESTIWKEFDVIAVPEPGTLGLVSAFAGGILFIRRRFMM